MTMSSCWLQKSPSKNVTYVGIAITCICILAIYQFKLGALLTANSRSINQGVYHSLSVDAVVNETNLSQLQVSTTLSSKLIDNQHFLLNVNDEKTTMNTKLENLLFADNKLWFQEKLTNYSKDIVSPTLKLENSNSTISTIRTKRILVWNKDFAQMLGPFGPGVGAEFFRAIGCPVWQCEASKRWNNSDLGPVEDYDAVFFHDPTWFNMSMPAKRSPHQIYIWYSMEPPGYHSYLKKWDASASLFNITWTYRWDSDIISPYGFFRPSTDDEIRNHKTIGQIKNNYAEGKSKLVVWFVSNCGAKNGRLDYAHQLQRHIPVDIYGECGNLTCKRTKHVECREMMGRDYKFVLAFENSMCVDYITEKYFWNLQFNIVPIVIDLNGNYAKMVPAGSYINALDFPTVKALANYLILLDKNDTLYNEYFWWKEYYVQGSSNGMCQLCSKLHDNSHPVSVYKNLTKWWHHDAACKVLTFPPESVDNQTWVAADFNPPYDGQWPHAVALLHFL